MTAQGEQNLTDMSKQILEIKKKIQLSEGQRKAHFEEWDGEKKRNKERIKQLKKEIKDLHVSATKREEGIRLKYPKEMRNKSAKQVCEVLDGKVADLKKKLDLLRHESVKCQNKMKVLADQYHTLLHRTTVRQAKKRAETMDSPEVSSLENQIHRVEMNLMEAEHVRKKYRIIRGRLLEDSVVFESTLVKMEDTIRKQEGEIKHLQDINGEALGLRDATRNTLVRQEISAINTARSRDKELQDLRQLVEERRLELERLERRIFPPGGRSSLVHQDSAGSQDGAPSQVDDAASKLTERLEQDFTKLKAATGETEAEDVLKRFLLQGETLTRLSYLRNITEKEKQDLQEKRDLMMAELETFKFAEVKDTEQNAEESERLKQEILEQENKRIRLEADVHKVTEQMCDIGTVLTSFCNKLQDVTGIPAPDESADLDDLQDTLARQVQWILDMTEVAVDVDNNLQPQAGEQVPPTRAPLEEEKPKPVLVATETDDEDEVPTRGFLKRQAQIIVDTKSRRKQFPMSRRH